jgi:hypothetical protein
MSGKKRHLTRTYVHDIISTDKYPRKEWIDGKAKNIKVKTYF